MALCYVFENEYPCTLAANHLFHNLVFDSHTVLGAANMNVQIQGDGHVGTTKDFRFNRDGQAHCIKHQVDKVDIHNFEYHYTVTESSFHPEYFEKVTHEKKVIPTPNGNVTKVKTTIFTREGCELREEHHIYGSQKCEIYQAVQGCLVNRYC